MSDFAPHNIGIVGSGTVYNHRGQQPAADRRPEPAKGVARESDRLDISSTARMLDLLRQGNVVREDLVAEVRDQIDSGTYETPDKLDAAIEELLGDL